MNEGASTPVEVTMLRHELGQKRFDILVAKTQTVLENQLKIKLPKGEIGKRISETLTPFVLDPGSIYPLEGLNSEIYPKKFKNPSKLSYQNDKLAAQPALSTVAGSMMIDNNKEVWWIDGKNMYGANEVSEKSNLVGDRMLRRLAELFFSKIKNIELTRYQGDGFLISSDKNIGNLEEEIRKIQEQIKTDPGLRNKLSAFFKVDGNILLDIGDFNLKKETPSLIVERDRRNNLVDLNKRIHKLLEYHPEFKTLTDDLDKLSIDEGSKIIEILEKSVFDHVIQPVAEKLSDKKFKVLAYRDVYDMTEHFAGQEIDMLKIDVASLLKKINDTPGLGTDIGDEYLRVLFTKVVESIKNQNPDLKEIGILRRWGDFFIPMEKGKAKQIKERLEKIFNEEYWYLTIDGDKKNPNLNFISEDDKKKHKAIFPIIPIIGLQTNINLETTNGNNDRKIDFIAIQNNSRTVGEKMNNIDENIRHRRPKEIKKRMGDNRWTQIDWNYLAETMINPFNKKRGLPRLTNVFDASPKEIELLKFSYYEIMTSEKDYDSDSWNLYKKTITKILERFN